MKHFSRILALVLVAALLCGALAGCGGSGESASPTATGGETVWVPKYLKVTSKN